MYSLFNLFNKNKEYSVKFLNYDGSLNCIKKVKYKNSCNYEDIIVSKPDIIKDPYLYEYKFAKWDSDLSSIIRNMEVKPIFSEYKSPKNYDHNYQLLVDFMKSKGIKKGNSYQYTKYDIKPYYGNNPTNNSSYFMYSEKIGEITFVKSDVFHPDQQYIHPDWIKYFIIWISVTKEYAEHMNAKIIYMEEKKKFEFNLKIPYPANFNKYIKFSKAKYGKYLYNTLTEDDNVLLDSSITESYLLQIYDHLYEKLFKESFISMIELVKDELINYGIDTKILGL